jgi:hypothetical protein
MLLVVSVRAIPAMVDVVTVALADSVEESDEAFDMVSIFCFANYI